MISVTVSIISGLALGGTFALVALGIVLAYRATGVFNFANGQLMLVAAFVASALQSTYSLPIVVIIILSVGLSALLSGLFYLLVLRHMTGRHQLMPVIATLGFASMLDGVVALAFRSAPYTFQLPVLPLGTTRLLGVNVASKSLAVTLFTILLALAVVAFLRFTAVGRGIRAAGQDPLLASQSGLNVKALHLGSWILAGSLAGVAGVMYSSTHLVDPSIVNLTLAAFPAILIGGLDSIPGAVVGGLAIGIYQGFVATFASPAQTDVYTYALLLVVILFMPNGLFGTAKVVRV